MPAPAADRASSPEPRLLRCNQGAGAAMIALGDHQPPRDRADAALDDARMLVEHEALDPGIAQQRLGPGQADDIVGAQQLFHRAPRSRHRKPTSETGVGSRHRVMPHRMRRISAAGHRRRDLPPGVRHLTRCDILCSLAAGRINFAPARPCAAPSEENPVAPVPIVDRDREGPPPSLEPLFRLLSGDLDRVNALIVERMDSPVALIAEGEVHQLITANDTATTEAAYLEVIEAKTAALFAAASRIGAVLADRPVEEEEALGRFGRNLGIAYQLIDDMLDFSAHPSEFGKSVGDDFRDGKITLPIVLAYARGDGEERAFWRRTLEQGEQGPGDLERALRLVERHGALAETLARARAYASDAIEALSPI